MTPVNNAPPTIHPPGPRRRVGLEAEGFAVDLAHAGRSKRVLHQAIDN